MHVVGLGVDLDAITRKLLDDGVAAFAVSFEALMASIITRHARLLADQLQTLAETRR